MTQQKFINFREHIPAFVSGFEPRSTDLEEGREFTDIPWLKEKMAIPGFWRFSISPAERSETYDTLMMEMQDNKFWVVAFVTPSGALPKLPIWKPTK